jgi:tetratricopeptide (TPR) repeat protein
MIKPKAPIQDSLRISRLSLALATLVAALISVQPAHALFFGYNQQAEAYKQQGEAAQEAQNYDMAINYFTSAINCLPL